MICQYICVITNLAFIRKHNVCQRLIIIWQVLLNIAKKAPSSITKRIQMSNITFISTFLIFHIVHSCGLLSNWNYAIWTKMFEEECTLYYSNVMGNKYKEQIDMCRHEWRSITSQWQAMLHIYWHYHHSAATYDHFLINSRPFSTSILYTVATTSDNC